MCYALRRARESDRETYRKFANHVYPPGQDATSYKNRIITFNYDDLLDARLLKRFGIRRVYFDRIQSDRAKTKRGESHPDPLLVKLHGSISWRCDKEEFERLIEDDTGEKRHQVESIWYEERRIPPPEDDTYPLMVPPIPRKPITRIEIFRYLWTHAYEYLHEAKEIVVAGYSLPETDELAMSLFSNFSNRRLERVTIVDPDPAIIGRWRRLFGRPNVGKARWTYYDDFADYVDQVTA
jgi:hypothetical protein